MLKRIYIEISNICNVQCSFCPVLAREKMVMGLDQFEKIIQQAAPLAEEICLHLLGEPLAHPQFLDILSLCQKYGAKIQLTTNGLLLKRYQNELANSPSIRQINFSLQAFRDNFPAKDLTEYLRPILEFTKMASALNPDLYVNYRLWNQSAAFCDNEEIYQLLESYFDIVINRRVDVGAIKSKRIWQKLYLHFDSRFEWPSMELPHQGTLGRCHGVLKHIGIHADGTVVPCCLDDKALIPLGNCRSTSLVDILKGERAQAMADGFLRGVLVEKLCQHCSYINRFKK